uniref:Uncharacterized protein n=1 Tax=Arundo donax TaxID=35708 RepID=A0A0A8ZAA0_ARUDO
MLFHIPLLNRSQKRLTMSLNMRCQKMGLKSMVPRRTVSDSTF